MGSQNRVLWLLLVLIVAAQFQGVEGQKRNGGDTCTSNNMCKSNRCIGQRCCANGGVDSLCNSCNTFGGVCGGCRSPHRLLADKTCSRLANGASCSSAQSCASGDCHQRCCKPGTYTSCNNCNPQGVCDSCTGTYIVVGSTVMCTTGGTTPPGPTPAPPTTPVPVTPVPPTPAPPVPTPTTTLAIEAMSSTSTIVEEEVESWTAEVSSNISAAAITRTPELPPKREAPPAPPRQQLNVSDERLIWPAISAMLVMNDTIVKVSNNTEAHDGGSSGAATSRRQGIGGGDSADSRIFVAKRETFVVSFSLTTAEVTTSKLCVRVVLTSGHRFTASAELAVDIGRAPSILADPDALSSTAQQRSPQSMEICLGPLPKPSTPADAETIVAMRLMTTSPRASPTLPPLSPKALQNVGGILAELEIRVAVEREPFVQTLNTVSSGAGIATGVASMVGGGPGAAAAAQRQELLAKAAWCPQPLSQDPPRLEASPMQLKVGDGEFALFVGAAYGNTATIITFVVFVTTVTALFAVCMAEINPPEEELSRPGAPLQRTSKWAAACSQTGFPGKLAPLLMFMYQPTLSAAMAVVLYDRGANQYVCGVLAAVLVIVFNGFPIRTMHGLMRESRLGVAPPIGYLMRPPSQVTDSCTAWLFAQTGRWESRFEAPLDPTDPQAPTFPAWAPFAADRFDSVVGDYRPGTHLTVVFDTLLGTAASLVLAYNPKTKGECIAVHGGTLLVFTLGLVMAAVRPFQRGCHNAFYATIAVLQWLMSVAAIVLVNTTDAAAMTEWEAWFSLADATVRVVVLVWTGAQVAEGVYEMLLPDEIGAEDHRRLVSWRAATHNMYSKFLKNELPALPIPRHDVFANTYNGGFDYDYVADEEPPPVEYEEYQEGYGTYQEAYYDE